ncbi:reverse transcriptase, partial [Phytophthora megakarya]
MTVSGTPPEPDDSGPLASRGGSSNHEVQASPGGGGPASTPAAPRESVLESPESAPMDAQVALTRSFVMVAMAGKSLDAEPAVYYHQGSDFVLLDMLKNQLAYLPDLSVLRPESYIEDAIVGEPGESDPEEEERLRAILRKHRMIFLGEGNAHPPPVRGVVCNLAVYELLKRLLETDLIEYFDSEWASAIVLVMKKNGIDVRLCIDYRNFAATMWFMTLDMASGFWAVPMTARDQLISAFICPLIHFQWKRMPFGLKNAPLIYQHFLDNCLWSFVRLPTEEERLVDSEVLEFLGISPEDAPMGPVLSRSSYIDDIIYGAPSWDDLCKTLNALLYRLWYWNISVLNLPFPKTQKGVQSFLGSLNYYAKFIEDLPVVAATLYEASDEQLRSGRDLEKPKHAFKILKDRLVSIPLLQHPDPGRQYVIILHANPWAISAVLELDHDGAILPVRFVGRVLQDAELRYHPAEKEVLELLRVLNTCHTMITNCSEKKIRVYTPYSMLAWLFKSKTVNGRCLKWAVNLSPWDLDIRRVENDEDGLAAILGAVIQDQSSLEVTDPGECKLLQDLNRIHEKPMKDPSPGNSR